MLIRTTETSLLRRVQLLDATGTAVTGVAFNNGSLAVSYLRPSDTAYQTMTLVDGTVGTYLANSWKEIGNGIYQVCFPDAAIVANGSTLVKVAHSGTRVQFDTLDALISSPVVTPITSPMPSDVVGVSYPRAVGDISPITVYGVVDSTGTAVNLTAQGALEVVADYIANPEIPDTRTNLLTTTATISGASNNDWTFTPNAATVALVGDNVYVSLRRVSDKKSFSEIRLNIRQAGLGS